MSEDSVRNSLDGELLVLLGVQSSQSRQRGSVPFRSHRLAVFEKLLAQGMCKREALAFPKSVNLVDS
jgi:hypothetical protein